MVRVVRDCTNVNGARRLRDAGARRRPRRSPRTWPRRPNPRPLRRPSRNTAPSASTLRAWTGASPRATTSTAIANGTWAEDDADSRGQVELRHVHRARRPVARTHSADHRGAGEGPEQQDRRRPMPASWTSWRSRRRASRPSTRGSIRCAGSTRAPGLPISMPKRASFGIGTPFGGFVGQDDKAPDQYILQFFQAGLGMPDRDYYLSQAMRSSPKPRRNIFSI